MGKLKIRFEVFKRDDFTCQYCGRKTPEVILELDHIVPKSKGGRDDLQNYITSCFECNRGKSNTPLNITKTRSDLKKQMYELAEKELQLQEYYAVREQVEKRIEGDLIEIGNYFFDDDQYVFGANWKRSVKYFLTIFTKDKIKEAIDICWRKFPYTNKDNDRFLYMCGIIRNWIKQNGR